MIVSTRLLQRAFTFVVVVVVGESFTDLKTYLCKLKGMEIERDTEIDVVLNRGCKVENEAG